MTVKLYQSIDSHRSPITEIDIDAQKSKGWRNMQWLPEWVFTSADFYGIKSLYNKLQKEVDKAVESCHPELIAAGVLTSQILRCWGFAIPD